MKKRLIALILCMAVFASLATGCTKSGDFETAEITNEFGEGFIEYPLDTDESLSVWVWLNSNLLKTCSSREDALSSKEIEKQTGVNIEWIHPTVGQEDQAFNLLFSSSDLPDIICNGDWRTFAGGGPDGAIESGYILDLTDLLPKYAPNYWKALQENPEAAKAARSLKGRYYDIGSLPHDLPVYGMIIRKDWLDELGLEVPETIEEWYTVLKAFKEKKGASAPLAFSSSNFYKQNVIESAFDTSSSFYMDNDKIKFGPMNDGYKEFVKEMAKWYKEGLLDVNVASSDSAALDAKILNGETGATMGYTSSTIGRYMNAKTDDNPMELVAAPYPVLKKGDKPEQYGKLVTSYNTMAAISATCKNPELALRWLDYAYTEKGAITTSYGIEGVSYEMKDGKPVLTDNLLNNPDGLSVSEALHYYALGTLGARGSADSFKQQLTTKQEKDSTEIWKVDQSHCMPPLQMSAEDQEEYGDIMVEIENYIAETTLKIICGQLPISTLDGMNAQLKKMKIDRAIELRQNAYNIYNKE